jgi:purine operon repressor
LSEDIDLISQIFEQTGQGRLETVSGAAGGVYYIPVMKKEDEIEFLNFLKNELQNPERIVSGGFVYINDVVFNPEVIKKAARIFVRLFLEKEIDYIATVEAKGIALASYVAQYFNKPLVVARNSSKFTEGSTVNISYISGTTGKIETMTMAKKAIKKGAKVLFIDDFMRGGGTVRGMKDLLSEFESSLVGVGVLIATKDKKSVDVDYKSLLILEELNAENKKITFSINPQVIS